MRERRWVFNVFSLPESQVSVSPPLRTLWRTSGRRRGAETATRFFTSGTLAETATPGGTAQPGGVGPGRDAHQNMAGMRGGKWDVGEREKKENAKKKNHAGSRDTHAKETKENDRARSGVTPRRVLPPLDANNGSPESEATGRMLAWSNI